MCLVECSSGTNRGESVPLTLSLLQPFKDIRRFGRKLGSGQTKVLPRQLLLRG